MSKARDLANAGTALSTVSATELGYLDGVTSAVQTQIDSKIGSASAINPTIVDAKGDIIAASAADTVARLAVGANDTVLTADSSTATGLKWATPSSGGLTLLSTTTLSGASVTISSINQSYKKLLVYIYGVTNATANSMMYLRPNSSSTISSFNSISAGAVNQQNSSEIGFAASADLLRTDANNTWTFEFDNYASTTFMKPFNFYGRFIGVGPTQGTISGGGAVITNSAITSFLIANYGGNLSTGTVLIYGVN